MRERHGMADDDYEASVSLVFADPMTQLGGNSRELVDLLARCGNFGVRLVPVVQQPRGRVVTECFGGKAVLDE